MATRRHFLYSTIASSILNAGPKFNSAHAAELSLSGTFSKNKLFFGSAVRMEELAKDAAFRDLILRECDYLTPEIALKWNAVEPFPGSFNFASMDALANVVLANKRQ